MTRDVVPLASRDRIASVTRADLDAARGGDRDAFERIVRTQFRMAFAVALSLVNEPSSAEDVVQDAFIRSWQRLGQCKEPAAFPGWLRSIVRSVALNHMDREAVRATSPLTAVQSHSPASPERDLDRELLRERLTDAMRGLTDLQREILLLYDLEGFKHGEIAPLLGISELMSRKHLSHARKRMRRALTEDDQGRVSR